MDYETIKTENQLLKDENDRLKNELTQTKEHLKKYTAPEYKKMYYEKLYGTWFAAVNFRSWQKMHYNFDGTYVAGYEWSKLHGAGRKIRLFLEYHMGYSVEGQFFGKRTHYGSAMFAYGF